MLQVFESRLIDFPAQNELFMNQKLRILVSVQSHELQKAIMQIKYNIHWRCSIPLPLVTNQPNVTVVPTWFDCYPCRKEYSNCSLCWSCTCSHFWYNWWTRRDHKNWQWQGVLSLHYKEKSCCWMIGSWTELMWLGESSLWMTWLHLLVLFCSLFAITWKDDANKHAMYSISSISCGFWLSMNTWWVMCCSILQRSLASLFLIKKCDDFLLDNCGLQNEVWP